MANQLHWRTLGTHAREPDAAMATATATVKGRAGGGLEQWFSAEKALRSTCSSVVMAMYLPDGRPSSTTRRAHNSHTRPEADGPSRRRPCLAGSSSCRETAALAVLLLAHGCSILTVCC